jgi:hypothetical protein
MSLNESIVEDAALEWFGELGGKRVKSEIGRVKSWSSFSISLFTLHSSSIRRLNSANPEEARATHKESLSVQNPSKGG